MGLSLGWRRLLALMIALWLGGLAALLAYELITQNVLCSALTIYAVGCEGLLSEWVLAEYGIDLFTIGTRTHYVIMPKIFRLVVLIVCVPVVACATAAGIGWVTEGFKPKS
jgi:hypothetical protein